MFKTIISSSVTCIYAQGNNGSFSEREFHAFHEIYMPLNRNSRMVTDSGIVQLKPNSIISIPSGNFHQFFPENGWDNYQRVFLQFASVPLLENTIETVMEEIKVFLEPTTAMLQLFSKLQNISSNIRDENDQKIILDSLFAEIMMEFKYNCKADNPYQSRDPMVSSVISYVDSHITTPISVDDIAKSLHFSVSSLSHRFRSTMNISLYRYILNKKLSKACELIKNGVPPTIASQQCGFQEYSGFYKQYKNYFGFSPSKTKF